MSSNSAADGTVSTPSKPQKTSNITYDDRTVRHFMIASVVFGLVAMLAGLTAALQLNFWQMNGKFLEWITFGALKTEGVEFITFGRLRPLHTNAAIFAFVGNMMFAGIYYSTQRLCKCRMASDKLSRFHFWGWQLAIVGAAISLPAGYSQGKEYAELIWPIDILVTVTWLVFAWNFFWTLKNRREPSLYVALWFYIATIVTVALLYVVNNLAMPVFDLNKPLGVSLVSYSIFGGVQDALVQWWYGHNAVAFFLTTPILGIMYYFLPKAANRPVYSYRLSIIHFWSLVFIYIWAGPHHLLNTSLPHWLQMLGMLFSLMLWAPSWGGMLNGLLTLRGAWDKLRTDPVIKFFAAGVTFYGMATFEGPLLAIRKINELSHYSDWTIGHVHSGTLGWNGLMASGMFYWLAPKLWSKRKDGTGANTLWSTSLANIHFWIALVGILLYVVAMWVSGIMQGAMLNTVNSTGTLVEYSFLETLEAIRLSMLLRAIGGALYLGAFILGIVNLVMTIKRADPVEETREVTEPDAVRKDKMSLGSVFKSDPIAYSFWGIIFLVLWILLPSGYDLIAMLVCFGLVWQAIYLFNKSEHGWGYWYDRLLENYMPFTILTFLAVAAGGVVQIIPTLAYNHANNVEDRLQIPYTPLELAGREIYLSEGCYNCHSQMIRTMVPDVLRYGPGDDEGYSRMGESIYDHPFQWGSKRTGPDLAREGGDLVSEDGMMRIGLRDNIWHFNHFRDPRSTSPGSNMPPYPWLFQKDLDFKEIPAFVKTMVRLGVPYEIMSDAEIEQNARDQALQISKSLAGNVVVPEIDPEDTMSDEAIAARLSEKRVIALIAYMQKLGAHEVVEDREKKGLIYPDSKRPSTSDRRTSSRN